MVLQDNRKQGPYKVTRRKQNWCDQKICDLYTPDDNNETVIQYRAWHATGPKVSLQLNVGTKLGQ